MMARRDVDAVVDAAVMTRPATTGAAAVATMPPMTTAVAVVARTTPRSDPSRVSKGSPGRIERPGRGCSTNKGHLTLPTINGSLVIKGDYP